MPTTLPLLDIQNLTIRFKTEKGFFRAVDEVNLKIFPGETRALVGESGSGKSLTALSILQILPRAAKVNANSKILFKQKDLLNYSEVMMRQVRGRRIGMIFQEPMSALNPVMTIGDQIAETIRSHESPRGIFKFPREHIIELLQQVGITNPERRIYAYPHQLSGGMKQRVMIAMMLAFNPEILIADEPTTALDVRIQLQILYLLKKLQAQHGMSILLITHDLGIVREMANNISVMYSGQIVEEAKTADFFQHPRHPYSKALFAALPSFKKRGQYLSTISGQVHQTFENHSGCNFAPRCAEVIPICTELAPTLVSLPGEKVRCHLYDEKNVKVKKAKKLEKNPGAHPPSGSDIPTIPADFDKDHAPLLEARDLKVYFPLPRSHWFQVREYVKAVDGINLTIPQGRTVALVGESGSGKTTVGRALLQLIPKSEGEIYYHHERIEPTTTQLKKIRRDIQMIFQDPSTSMNPRLLVEDILAEGIRAQGLEKNKKHIRKTLENLLSQVGLSRDALSRYPHEFSGGQKQRLAIARALAVKPRLLICDEPTSALDVSIQAQILNLLKSLQQGYNLTYLFITHNLAVVSYLADYVIVMRYGKIVEEGSVESVLKNPKDPYTQELLNAVRE